MSHAAGGIYNGAAKKCHALVCVQAAQGQKVKLPARVCKRRDSGLYCKLQLFSRAFVGWVYLYIEGRVRMKRRRKNIIRSRNGSFVFFK